MTNAAGMNLKSWLLTGTLCIAGLATTQAQAQTAPDNATATERGGLQEITVTATRREESLSKVPISVTALTQEEMDNRGIKDFQDIVRYTPGVNIDNSGTNAISIRGISSSGGAGTTGIYIDDTPIQMRSLGFSPDDTLPKTFDLQRVEVLRGPQGTLFGAGAEGGAVRYILTPASTTTPDTYVRSEMSYTQYGQPNGEIGIARGQPVADGVFGVRASIWYRYDGGWIDRVDPGTYPPTTVAVNHNVNYSNSIMGAARGDLAAQRHGHRHAERPLSAPGQARRLHLLAGVLEPGAGGLQYRDPRARGRSRYLLSAGTKGPMGPGHQSADRQRVLLSSQAIHRLPGHGV